MSLIEKLRLIDPKEIRCLFLNILALEQEAQEKSALANLPADEKFGVEHQRHLKQIKAMCDEFTLKNIFEMTNPRAKWSALIDVVNNFWFSFSSEEEQSRLDRIKIEHDFPDLVSEEIKDIYISQTLDLTSKLGTVLTANSQFKGNPLVATNQELSPAIWASQNIVPKRTEAVDAFLQKSDALQISDAQYQVLAEYQKRLLAYLGTPREIYSPRFWEISPYQLQEIINQHLETCAQRHGLSLRELVQWRDFLNKDIEKIAEDPRSLEFMDIVIEAYLELVGEGFTWKDLSS